MRAKQTKGVWEEGVGVESVWLPAEFLCFHWPGSIQWRWSELEEL